MDAVTSAPQHPVSLHGAEALSPLDGRYASAVAPLAAHLSEAALNRERLRVEIAWLRHLAQTRAVPTLRELTEDEGRLLDGVLAGFGPDAVAELAAIERVTQHDVKAVEYLLKERMAGTTLADV